MESLYLGIDGGQTSTTALIADEIGRVKGFGRGGPCNHVGAELGRQRFVSAITECLSNACLQAGLDPCTVCFQAVAAGFSGGPADKRELLAELVRTGHLSVTSDIDTALAGALAGEAGIVVIAGTGSVAFGKNACGEAARAGGWGYVFGDEGGAFDIVRQALRAALRQEEEGGPVTVLHDRLLQATGIGHVHNVVRKFYTADYSTPRIASFASLVDQAAVEGDVAAIGILDNAAAQLARLVEVVRNRLFPAGEMVRTSYIGGVFRSGLVFQRYRALVEKTGCSVTQPVYGPAGGALLEAYRLVNRCVTLNGVPQTEK